MLSEENFPQNSKMVEEKQLLEPRAKLRSWLKKNQETI